MYQCMSSWRIGPEIKFKVPACWIGRYLGKYACWRQASLPGSALAQIQNSRFDQSSKYGVCTPYTT